MPRSPRADALTEDDQRDFEAIADELYAQRPDEFASSRDEHVRKARAEGRRGLASQLSTLRRPTQSAWLVNLLWRDQRDVLQQLLDLGEAFREAQQEASGPRLRELMEQRREVEAALLRRARELAEQAGVDVSASMEREAQDTLAAALADPAVADEVQSGRLVKPAAYAGFGALPAVPAPKPSRAAQAEQREKVIDLAAAQRAREAATHAVDERREQAQRQAATREVDERREQAQRQAEERARQRRAAAEQGLREARAAADAAAQTLAESTRAEEAARQRRRELEGDVQRAREKLARLEGELDTAERAAVAATKARDQAARVHEASARAIERAERELSELTP